MQVVDVDVESAYSIERFLRQTCEKRTPGERFEVESERVLRIDLDGGVWLKPGAAIAYPGDATLRLNGCQQSTHSPSKMRRCGR